MSEISRLLADVHRMMEKISESKFSSEIIKSEINCFLGHNNDNIPELKETDLRDYPALSLLRISVAALDHISRDKDQLFSVQQCSTIRNLIEVCSALGLYALSEHHFSDLYRLVPILTGIPGIRELILAEKEKEETSRAKLVEECFYRILSERRIGIIRQSIAANQTPLLISARLSTGSESSAILNDLVTVGHLPLSIMIKSLCLLIVARPKDPNGRMLRSLSHMLCDCLMTPQNVPEDINSLSSGGILALIDATAAEEIDDGSHNTRTQDVAPWQRNRALAILAVFIPHLSVSQDEFFRSLCYQLSDILSLHPILFNSSESTSKSPVSDKVEIYLRLSLIIAEQLAKRNRKLFDSHFTKRFLPAIQSVLMKYHLNDENIATEKDPISASKTQLILSRVKDHSPLWTTCEKYLRFRLNVSDSTWAMFCEYLQTGSESAFTNQLENTTSTTGITMGPITYADAISALESSFMPERAHGFISLKNLIYAEDAEAIREWEYILRLIEPALVDSESYIFLSAIGTLTALAHLAPDRILPIIIREYLNEKRSLQERLFIGESISCFSRHLGRYKSESPMPSLVDASHFSILPPSDHLSKCVTNKRHVKLLADALLPTLSMDSHTNEPILIVSALSNLAALTCHPNHGQVLDELLPVYINSIRKLVSQYVSYDIELEMPTAETRKVMGEARRAALMWISELFRVVSPKHIALIKKGLPDLHLQLLALHDSIVAKENKRSCDEATRLQTQLALEEMDRLAMKFLNESISKLSL